MQITKAKLKEIILDEYQKLTEADYDKTPIPQNVKRFMKKFIEEVKGANLNKIKRVAILFKVIQALGIEPNKLQTYIQKIKKEI